MHRSNDEAMSSFRQAGGLGRRLGTKPARIVAAKDSERWSMVAEKSDLAKTLDELQGKLRSALAEYGFRARGYSIVERPTG